MNSERIEALLRAIGEIDDSLIVGAATAPSPRKRKPLRFRWEALAACLCLIAVVGSAALLFAAETPLPDPGPGPSAAPNELPRWEELAVWQQYSATDDGYCCAGSVLPIELLGEEMGSITLTGRDSYAPEDIHRIRADTCAVLGISPECVIAVRYQGDDDWYAFYSQLYCPETLGQFLEDLNLREHISLGAVSYDYRKNSRQRATACFYGITTDQVWALLMDAPEAENLQNILIAGPRIMDISVDIPLLGITNISLAVTENGYLTTNILATGKAFYIGEDRVQAFVDFVKENLDCTETVYDSEEPDMTPEEPSQGWSIPSQPPAEK